MATQGDRRHCYLTNEIDIFFRRLSLLPWGGLKVTEKVRNVIDQEHRKMVSFNLCQHYEK
jgi:hypothetical protein